MTLIAPGKFFFLEILNGLQKKTGGARKTRVFFLASSLTPGAYFITHHFQASQVFKSPALYNDQLPPPPPPPPSPPGQITAHCIVSFSTLFFIHPGKVCNPSATIRTVHKTLQRRDSTPPTLHPFSNNPLREKNFVPGHLGEIVAFVLKTKWRFGVYQY